MSEIILLSGSDYESDVELKNLITVPIGMLDAAHPNLTREQRKRILQDKYKNKLIADGLDTGLLKLNHNGEYIYQSRQHEHVFKGFVFEALLVRLCNDNLSTIGKNAYSWCTERKQVRTDRLNKMRAFGRGFLSTKTNLRPIYNTTHKFDVQFYFMNNERNEPEVETIVNTKIEAGIQVKAITGNEKSEIIDSLLNKAYTHVLTCLKHTNGVHSYNVCMKIIREMHRLNSITLSQRTDLESRIYCPDQLGINQSWIDEYSEYISTWWRGQVAPDVVISDAQGAEIKGYKNENSILVPV